MASNIKILDPVQGLIDYVNDIKPYHSKVIEALIEYVGTDKVEVTVLEHFDFTIGLLYEFEGELVCIIGGYGTPSFGDPENIMVLSPDVSRTILEYPAIGAGFFIVLGDRTRIFASENDLDLIMTSFVEDKILSLAGSPLTEIYVTGDKTATYYPTLSISIEGSIFNDGNYTVASSTAIASPSLVTRITVNETIPTNSVEGFVRVHDATNSGTFTVVDSEYVSALYIPHTIVYMTGVSISAPTLTDSNQRFVSFVNTQPLEYSQVLAYSTALRGSPPQEQYLADEGTLSTDIVNLTATSFSILGNFESSNVFVGDEIMVRNSSGNDGDYTITDLSYEYDATVGDFVTKISVPSVPDINVDGKLILYIPSNVFVIAGADYTDFFVQGTRVNTTSGTYIGTYTVLASNFINDKTYIRVREGIIDEHHDGTRILTTGNNYIGVPGDLTSTYTDGHQLNVVGSAKNNGSFTAAGSPASTYDPITNITQINLAEPYDATDVTGQIYEFTPGDIKYIPEGFGATVDLCELVPQALTSSTITEHFELFFGHKFIITSTQDAGAGVYYIFIDDNDDQDIYNIFTTGLAGSPPKDTLEIIDSGVNDGTYTIHTVISTAGQVRVRVIESLVDTGVYSGSPYINGGIVLYDTWYQYFITNIDNGSPNSFLVAGDATEDITVGSPPTVVRHLFTGADYTVNAVSFDGENTTIAVNEPIVTVAGSPPVDVTAGSPPFDDWIISI